MARQYVAATDRDNKMEREWDSGRSDNEMKEIIEEAKLKVKVKEEGINGIWRGVKL